MADTEESPAQRQARIRREKREAKIKGTGQDRLDKITRLSGRTPESMRTESPIDTPARTASPALSPAMPSTPTPSANPDPDQLRAQEEYLRALLRNPDLSGQQNVPGADQEDPMMKMLQSVLGQAPEGGGMPSFNPDELAKATGLPSFVTNMMLGAQEAPKPAAQVKEERAWTFLHILFAVLAGFYLLFTVNNMTAKFGTEPPAPATFQNPLAVFILGEVTLHSSRAVFSNIAKKRGFGFWIQIAKDLVRDALVLVFLMGAYTWWQGIDTANSRH